VIQTGENKLIADKLIANKLIALARAAIPECELDYASERQVDAENAFYDMALEYLTEPERESLERWLLKATVAEGVTETLRRIGIITS